MPTPEKMPLNSLHPEVVRFLEAIHVARGALAGRFDLPVCNRDQDKARQFARKHGLAKAVGMKWMLTDAGKALFAEPK